MTSLVPRPPGAAVTSAVLLALVGLVACSSSPPAQASAPDPPDSGAARGATNPEASPGQEASEARPADPFAACPAQRPATGSFPDDVAAVLAGKCQPCHQSPTKNHAPFALLTYAETQGPDPLPPYTGTPIWQVMHAVIQPGGVPHMPFGNAPQLTAAEMQVLDGWLLGCALPASNQDAGADAAE